MRYILERRVRPEPVKYLLLVQDGVQQVEVVGQLVRQARVDDLQDHPEHFFEHVHVLYLKIESSNTRMNDRETALKQVASFVQMDSNRDVQIFLARLRPDWGYWSSYA